MAQVSGRLLSTSVVCVLLLAGAASAQAPLPDVAIAAETEERWEDALSIYRDLLKREPRRADLWVRIADIEARLGNEAVATKALAAAVDVAPQDPDLHVRLSEAYAASDDPNAALRSIERALALRADQQSYLRSGVVLATWNGDYSLAAEWYQRLQALDPADVSIAFKLARVSAWSGDTTRAAAAYRQYLNSEPNDADAWLELAAAESWRGNYAGALDVLEQYLDRFGESRAYTILQARVLAGAGRPSAAVNVLEPLWRQDPDDYEVNLARTVALAARHDVGDTYAALDSLRRAEPTSRETLNAERLVRATIGSSIGPSLTYYSDSDGVQITGIAPSGSLVLRTGSELSTGYARYVLEGSRESGLGRMAGGAARLDRGWAGLAQTFGGLTLSARVGAAVADGRRRTEGAVGMRWVSDRFEADVELGRGFVGISPRTVELGLMADRGRLAVAWTPSVRGSVSAEATLLELSDGNRQWNVSLSPRLALVRSQRVNLDLGVSAHRLETTRDLSNGYYDPRRYEAYQASLYPYLKIAEDVGLGLSLTIGAQRERTFPFQLGGSVGAEATFGIYRAWLLRVSAGATHNLRQESGAFRAYRGTAQLVRRF